MHAEFGRKLQASLQRLLSHEGDRLSISTVCIAQSEKTESHVRPNPGDLQAPTHRRSFDQSAINQNSALLQTAPILVPRCNHEPDPPSTFLMHPPQHNSFGSPYFLGTDWTYYYGGSNYAVILRVQRAHYKSCMPGQKAPVRAQQNSSEYLYGLRIALRLFLSRRLDFGLSISPALGRLGSLSLNFNFSFPRIVPPNAPIMNLAHNGDLSSMESLFRAGKASPTDVLGDGTTLLHVGFTFLSARQS